MSGSVERFLEGKRVLCLDSNAIIYFIQENAAYLPILLPIFEQIDLGFLRAYSSFLTLIEVLIQPIRDGRVDLANQYRDLLLGSRGWTLFPVEETVSERAADLRVRYNLRIPDAIQLATAIEYGAQAFLTNDEQFQRVREIEVVTLQQLGGER